MKPISSRDALCFGLAEPAEAVASLRAVGWKARDDVAPWPLVLPVDWAADPFQDRNWRFQLNAWRPIGTLITAHDRLQDDALLDDIVALMLDWERFEAASSDQALLWNDMGSGLRAAKLAYVLTQTGLADPRFDAARPVLIALARRHLARLRDPAFIGDTNHALAQVHGAMALCLTLPDAPEAQGGQAYVEATFLDLLRSQFGREGVHLEHSPGYHVFALKAVRKFAATGWYDSMPALLVAIKRAAKRLQWFTFPDGTVSEFGDSSGAPVKVRRSRKVSHVVGRLFRESGYAIVRHWTGTPSGQASMLIVAAGHHSRTHKHADDLSFELFEQGRRIIVDTGKYSYSRLDWRDFTYSAAAHNAIDLLEERADNGVRDTPPVGGMLNALHQTQWGWIVRGGFSRPAFGVAHQRTFLYRPGEWLVLLDHVVCDRSRRMTAWLHLAPALKARPLREGWTFPGGWAFPGGSIRYQTSVPAKRHRHRGQIKPRFQGWKATGYHERTPCDALGLTFSGSDVRIATIIGLGDRRRPDVTVRVEADGFQVDHAGAVIFRGDAPVDAGPPGTAFK